MLTPQDIQDVKFVRSMKGYDKEQVEDFLDSVHSDYTALYKENATLKGKMRVLVDKIEEYRSVDEQMRKAFYSAQVTAQDTVAKAQAEADIILRNARQEAEGRVNDIRRQIEAEEARLELAKAECRKYSDMMKRLLGQNISFIEVLMEKSASQIVKETIDPQRGMEEKIDSFEVSFDHQEAEAGGRQPFAAEKAADFEDDTIELDGVEKETEPQVRAAVGGDMDDSTRFNFSELRFGKDYKEEED